MEAHVQFGVLGTLEVVDDDGIDIPFSSAKQRTMLTVLLCHRGQPVAIDTLSEALWGEPVPTTARANLQVYVHRLRRALGEERIEHSQSGYLLHAEPHEIDVTAFEAGIAEGYRALHSGDAELAGAVLMEAMSLWRGTPFVDGADSPYVATEAARLDELRLVALEARIDADLALDRHGPLVAELTSVVEAYPLRERFRGQLMLALYRAGRSADALAVYRETRELLIDELGLEPGVPLRELEQAILTDDPALTPSRPSTHPTGVDTVPAELPVPDPAFTGRFGEVSRITGALTGGDATGTVVSIVTVDGPGGMGKSALAVRAAHVVRTSFPDGQLYTNLRGATPGAEPLEPLTVLSRFLRSLGVSETQIPEDLDEAAALFRTLTSARRLLVVIDDAPDHARVRPLLPGTGSGAAALITSRPVLASLEGSHRIHLESLSDVDAVVLLARLAGSTSMGDDPDAAADVVRLCGNLPLAIRIAGARLTARADWTLTSLRRRLSDTRARLDELEYDDLAIRGSCAVSHHSLAPDAARLFELLGLVDFQTITPSMATALADVDLSAAERALDGLVDAQLLQVDTAGRFAFHDLIAIYAREQAELTLDPAERDDAVRRVLHHYLATANAATAIVAPGREVRLVADIESGRPADLADGAAVGDWIQAEAANLVTAVRHAAQLDGDGPTLVAGLAAALTHPLNTQGRWADLYTIGMVAIASADRHGESWLGGLARNDCGIAACMLGRTDEGERLFLESLASFDAAGDLAGRALVLGSLGNVSSITGNHRAGVTYQRQAIEAYQELGDVDGRARAMTNLALLHEKLGELDTATELYTQGIEAHEAVGNSVGAGAGRLNFGRCLMVIGHHDDAIGCFEDAVATFHTIGDRRREAIGRWGLASSLAGAGRAGESTEHRERSVNLMRAMNLVSIDDAEELLAEPPMLAPAVLRD